MIEDLSVPVPVPNGLIAHLNPKIKINRIVLHVGKQVLNVVLEELQR
jgi:hypothetical protein